MVNSSTASVEVFRKAIEGAQTQFLAETRARFRTPRSAARAAAARSRPAPLPAPPLFSRRYSIPSTMLMSSCWEWMSIFW